VRRTPVKEIPSAGDARPGGARGSPMTPDDTWKRYPYVPEWGDPRQFTFPNVDGHRPGLGVATYFVDGFLRGRASGRLYAFMTIFLDMRVVRRRLRVAFHTFALFDCDRRHYGTCTDFDLPHPLRRGRHKLAAAPGHLALRYRAPAGTSRWEALRDADGTLRPFAWARELHGTDHHGARMALELELDATRPPAPLGGRELGGEMMFLGAERTYSYFQSGLVMRGRLTWGDQAEEVEGETGWIDRQWAERHFAVHQDWRNARYRSEWRVMQFDNGWDMSCFHQYHRHQHNAVVPWSGLAAQGPAPAFALRATTRVELVIPEFIRSPGVVPARFMLTRGPRYFPHRYRLRAPEWDMDVHAEPLVDAPRTPPADRVLDRARAPDRHALRIVRPRPRFRRAGATVDPPLRAGRGPTAHGRAPGGRAGRRPPAARLSRLGGRGARAPWRPPRGGRPLRPPRRAAGGGAAAGTTEPRERPRRRPAHGAGGTLAGAVMPAFRRRLGVLVAVPVVFGALTLAALEGQEVVVVHTRDASGAVRATRTWIADEAGYAWVEAADDARPFLRHLEADPEVELRRHGTRHRCHALRVANPGGHERIRRLLARKYGWADRWIGLLVDTSASSAVRLACE